MIFSKTGTIGEAASAERQGTRVIPGDLVLYRNTTFVGSVAVQGNITGYKGRGYNLTILDGNLSAQDIVLGDLKLPGNVRARSMDVQDLRCNNVSVVRELYCKNVFTANISADEICAKRVKAEGDIAARILVSLTSISAKDLFVDYVSAVKDIKIRNAEAKDSIITERDIFYNLICHAHRKILYRHAYPQSENAPRPFVSSDNIDIKNTSKEQLLIYLKRS